MSSKSKPDVVSILIGSLIVGFVIWKVVAYILPDKELYANGQELLEDVMLAQGGFENWNAKSSLHFTKQFKLYAENGTIEIDRNETHKYLDKPRQEYNISWKQQQDDFLLVKKEDSIYQLINNVKDTLVTRSQLLAKLNAAQFVINIPYSLNDESASLEYEGVKIFQDVSCHVLKVNFKDSRDTWRLYFGQKDFSWVGYWVQTEDHYSLVINEEMVDVDGFTLSRKRKSYRTDNAQNILYLRAEYLYDSYEIN